MRISQAAINTLVKTIGSSFGESLLKEFLPKGKMDPKGQYISNEFVSHPINGFTTWKMSGRKTAANYVYLLCDLFDCSPAQSYDYLSKRLFSYEIDLKDARCSRPDNNYIDPLGGFKAKEISKENSMIFHDSNFRQYMAKVVHGRNNLWAIWTTSGWNFKMKPEPPFSIEILNDDPKGDIVIIVQTVRAANFLKQAGFTVATWGGPDNAKVNRIDWTVLKDREIIVWPTNNIVSIENFSQILSTVCCPAKQSSILDVSDLQPNSDACDTDFNSPYLIEQFITHHRLPLPCRVESPGVPGGLKGAAEKAALGNTVAAWGCSMNQHGVPHNSADNSFKIIKNDPFLKGKIKFNEIKKTFTVEVNLTKKTDKSKKSEVFMDSMRKYVLCYLQSYYNPHFSLSSVDVSLGVFSEQEEFIVNPIKDLIVKTKWDGTKRIENFFFNYSCFPTEDDNPAFYQKAENKGMQAYLPFVGEKIFCSLIRRLFEPGSYLDNIIVFFGKQGQGKSKLLDVISMDNVVVIANSISKDINRCYELLNQAWIVDFPDMAAFEKTSEDVKKAVFSSQTDSFRGAYGRSVAEKKRSCVIFSSTNKQYWLKDQTGARRYIIIDLKSLDGNESQLMFDFQKIRKDITQIYAEAYSIYNKWLNVRKTASDIPPWEAYFFPSSIKDETMGYRYLKRLRIGGFSGSPNEELWIERILHGLEREAIVDEVLGIGDLYSFVDAERSFIRAPRDFSSWLKDFLSSNDIKYKVHREGHKIKKGFKINANKLKEIIYGISS